MKKEQVPEVANMSFFECRCPRGFKYIEIMVNQSVGVNCSDPEFANSPECANATNCSDPEFADSPECANATNCSDPEFANSTECIKTNVNTNVTVKKDNLTALEGICLDINEW